MSTDIKNQVLQVIQAIEICSSTGFSWFGKLSPKFSRKILNSISPQTARGYLHYYLQSCLYSNFYCKGFAAAAEENTQSYSPISMTTFVRELSHSNSGTGYWESGWEVKKVENNKVIVKKENLTLRAFLQDCYIDGEKSIRPGSIVLLHFPKEFLNLSPGFYMAVSNREFANDSDGLIRFYWNFTSEGAINFMQKATLKLNQANLQFKLKALNNPGMYTRCDAVVLYSKKRDYNEVINILEEIYPDVCSGLKPGTPVFSKILANGLGFAEDPGNGDSFGIHRCRILSEGVVLIHDQKIKNKAEQLQIIEEQFSKYGISLEEAYLNPYSKDIYCFQSASNVHQFNLPKGEKATDASYPAHIKNGFLQAAIEIGQTLTQNALWHSDRCNWLGFSPDETKSVDTPSMKFSAMGPELYSGTSGIALFLIELYSVTGDLVFRNASLGAIRHSLSCADTIRPASRIGLYTGLPGIAYAASRIGKLLNNEDLLVKSRLLIEQACQAKNEDCGFDLLYGYAGAISTMLFLRDDLSDTLFVNSAIQLGDELIQSADKTDAGYSWKSPGVQKHRNLTGFSHGTAGVGYALLELFAVTKDSKYLNAAKQAFMYERHLFDIDAGNWPDFRQESGPSRHQKQSYHFTTTWCHGAPGIALSRLRAYEILGDISYKDEAVAALQTTHQTTSLWFNSGIWNYSLCHGLSGNSEVLIFANDVLGKEWTNGLTLPYAVACDGIERFARNGQLWPCGTGGQTPGLMLGLAGIGLFYLRLYDSEIPSPLILRKKHVV